jgi:ribose/xylose/arabinose/galactoside ABC-type transport system permease subunit
MVIIYSLAPAITGPAAPYILLIFGFLALLVVDVIIAIIEGTALTLLKWNPFRTCLTIALVMNLVAGLINGILLILLQHTPIIWLPVSFAISLLVDALILTYFKRQALKQNSLYALLVNLASYILLILPAYYFGSHP